MSNLSLLPSSEDRAGVVLCSLLSVCTIVRPVGTEARTCLYTVEQAGDVCSRVLLLLRASLLFFFLVNLHQLLLFCLLFVSCFLLHHLYHVFENFSRLLLTLFSVITLPFTTYTDHFNFSIFYYGSWIVLWFFSPPLYQFSSWFIFHCTESMITCISLRFLKKPRKNINFYFYLFFRAVAKLFIVCHRGALILKAPFPPFVFDVLKLNKDLFLWACYLSSNMVVSFSLSLCISYTFIARIPFSTLKLAANVMSTTSRKLLAYSSHLEWLCCGE